MYTNQTAFDAMVRHLASMKDGRSIADGLCLYRGPNGKKCAVGALIPDEMYSPSMDRASSGIGTIVREHPHIAKLFHDVGVDMLADMQSAHDNYGNWTSDENGERFSNLLALSKVATRYHLDDTSVWEDMTT